MVSHRIMPVHVCMSTYMQAGRWGQEEILQPRMASASHGVYLSPTFLFLIPLPQGTIALIIFTWKISLSGFTVWPSLCIPAITEHRLTPMQSLNCHLLQWQPITTCLCSIPADSLAFLTRSLTTPSLFFSHLPGASGSQVPGGLALGGMASTLKPQSCHLWLPSPQAFLDNSHITQTHIHTCKITHTISIHCNFIIIEPSTLHSTFLSALQTSHSSLRTTLWYSCCLYQYLTSQWRKLRLNKNRNMLPGAESIPLASASPQITTDTILKVSNSTKGHVSICRNSLSDE